MRPVTIEPFPTAAPGSIVITQGGTRVLCTASVERDVPAWVRRDEQGRPAHGWVTAEYNMLPGSTPGRKKRGPDSRGTEIQRLIARALRSVVDLKQLPGAVTCDCDVLAADGGTRTASITGACVALAMALRKMPGELPGVPGGSGASRCSALGVGMGLTGLVAAVSVGMVDGEPVLDLDYALDVRAEVDMNVAMTDAGRFVEVQGTGEKALFDRGQLDAMLDLAQAGIAQLLSVQRAFLAMPAC